MLSFDELFDCLVLLIACRMSGKFSWQTAVLHWPFLRPMIAWLELTIADVHEYAEMMNRSIRDDQERQVALSMEHDRSSRASSFSAWMVSKNVATCLAWFYVLFSFCGDRFEFSSGFVWSVEVCWMRAYWERRRDFLTWVETFIRAWHSHQKTSCARWQTVTKSIPSTWYVTTCLWCSEGKDVILEVMRWPFIFWKCGSCPRSCRRHSCNRAGQQQFFRRAAIATCGRF